MYYIEIESPPVPPVRIHGAWETSELANRNRKSVLQTWCLTDSAKVNVVWEEEI